MPGFVKTEGLVINIFGGIKLNAMENTASFNYGDVTLSNFHSQNKSTVQGQVFGDLDMVNQTPLGSPIFDSDLVDTPLKTLQNEMGLED